MIHKVYKSLKAATAVFSGTASFEEKVLLFFFFYREIKIEFIKLNKINGIEVLSIFSFQTASTYPFLFPYIECVLMLKSYLWQWQENVISALFFLSSKIYSLAKY